MKMFILCLAFTFVVGLIGVGTACAAEPVSKTLQVTSTAFDPGASIPKKHTGEGEDVSPPLAWTAPPEGTKSVAVICGDPDAPVGTWVHWVAWNVPASSRGLPEAVPAKNELADGTRQGTNDFRKIGYGGPMPPPGAAHRYYFRVYALDAALTLKSGATKKDLVDAMQGHILAQGELMGRYKR